MGAAKRIVAANWYSPNSQSFYQPHRLKNSSGGGAAAPAWAPTDKSGLLFWFKADAGVTQASNLVSQWDDQSGNGYHATAAGAQRPTYTASALNSLPGISFPASTWLDFGGATTFFTSGSPFSIVLVWKNATAGGTWYHVACSLNTPVANRRFAILASNDASYGDINWSYVGAGAGVSTIKAAGDVTTTATGLTINYAGGNTLLAASWDGYRNDTGLTETVGGDSQSLGNNSKLGGWYDGSLNLIGSIYEIFAYNSVLTAGELTEVFTYRFNKWAI